MSLFIESKCSLAKLEPTVGKLKHADENLSQLVNLNLLLQNLNLLLQNWILLLQA